MSFEPNPGEGFEFFNDVRGGAIPQEYIPGVLKGTEAEMGNGIPAGFPVVDFKARVLDGQFPPVDSSVMSFEICGCQAFKEMTPNCGPLVLEPVMKVEVVSPEGYMGLIFGDLNFCRGVISNFAAKNNLQVLQANVPLFCMFSYILNLRSLSKGWATFSLEFGPFGGLPENLAAELTGDTPQK
eukprot:UN4289